MGNVVEVEVEAGGQRARVTRDADTGEVSLAASPLLLRALARRAGDALASQPGAADTLHGRDLLAFYRALYRALNEV